MKVALVIGYLLLFTLVFFLAAHFIGQQAHQGVDECVVDDVQPVAPMAVGANPFIFPPLAVYPDTTEPAADARDDGRPLATAAMAKSGC